MDVSNQAYQWIRKKMKCSFCSSLCRAKSLREGARAIWQRSMLIFFSLSMTEGLILGVVSVKKLPASFQRSESVLAVT